MLSTQRILALNVGSGKLVLAEFSVKAGQAPTMVRYGQAPLPADAEGEPLGMAVEAALREVMRETGIRPAPVLLALPGQTVFPRFVKLPSVARDKLAQMIQYEAEQNVPFPINEVVWDYELIGNDDLGEQNAMIVAVKTETARVLIDAVVRAGLDPELVDIAPMAIYNALRYNCPDLDGCSLVVDIGARSTNLIFSEGEKVFSRSIPVAGNAITQEIAKTFQMTNDDAESLKCAHGFVAQGGVFAVDDETLDRISKVVRNVMTRLHAEISRSINFYRSQQGGTAPKRIFLTGGSAVMPHMDDFFKEKLQTEVLFLNPFVNIQLGAAVDVARVERDAFVLVEAVGLALRRVLTCPVEINLMPSELVRSRVMRGRIPYFVGAAVGAVLSLAVWTLYAGSLVSLYEKQQAMTGDELQARQSDENAFKKLIRERDEAQIKVDFVRNRIKARSDWPRIVGSLRTCFLDGSWLVSVSSVKDPVTGEITGVLLVGQGWSDRMRAIEADAKKQGKTLTAVELLCDRLRANPVFGSDRTTVRIVNEREVETWLREFTIEASLATSATATATSGRKPAGRR